MTSFREMSVGLSPLSSLNNQELRLAIVREVLAWGDIREARDGRITGSLADRLTTVPVTAPDWLCDNESLNRLELLVRRRGWQGEYKHQLAIIAGEFNPSPTNRQRCEAILLTARTLPMNHH